uniref:Variant surface glycoprotein n=1 Tax=Trypanosoma brucei TaxID=5691 RepID=A0A1V0FYA4_9TRYP|nr:variant surface glycoprotein [Trypanosoma brucei]
MAASEPDTTPLAKAAKLRIAAMLTTDAATIRKQLALAAMYSNCHAKAITARSSALKSATRAVAALAHIAGRSETLKKLAKLKIAAVTQQDANSAQQTKNAIKPDSAATGLDKKVCSLLELGKNTKLNAEKTTAKGYKLESQLINPSPATNDPTETEAAVCGGNTGSCTDSGTGTKHGVRKGTVYRVSQAKEHVRTATTTGTTSVIWHAASQDESDIGNYVTTMANSEAAAVSAAAEPCEPWTEIGNEVFLQNIAAWEIPIDQEDKLNEKQRKIQPATLTALYDTKDEELTAKIWKSVDAIQLTKENSGVSKPAKLGDFTGTQRLLLLEAAVAARKNNAVQSTPDFTAQQEEASGPNTEAVDKKNREKKDECTATEEDKCDKTKCDWNAEKKQCKVKEGAAFISAVIKAPLLLAVLLL